MLPEARFVRYDWEAGAAGTERKLDPSIPLIVEGCGAVNPAAFVVAKSLGIRTLSAWVECEAHERRRRASERDGGRFCAYWKMWADQENTHQRVNQPRSRAQVLIHTSRC